MNVIEIASRIQKFMDVNKRFSFSKEELEYVAKEVTKSHKVSKSLLNATVIDNTLVRMGRASVYKRHSKSQRHKLWCHVKMDADTLKLSCKV